jgi:hypothetical protein
VRVALNKLIENRPDLIQSKKTTGAVYGLVCGLAFATIVWGGDGLRLSQAHAYLPWINYFVAMLYCGIFGAAAGWLTMVSGKNIWGLACWLVVSILFAWLVVGLPMVVNPFLVSWINPQVGSYIRLLFSLPPGSFHSY